MSEKEDGDMRLGNPDTIKNRKKFFEKLGIEKRNVVSAGLVHGNKAALAEEETERLIAKTDALVTRKKNIFLTITVADCLPVIFFDPKNQVIGLAHAGWRSLLSGILENTFSLMKKSGARTQNTLAWVGPAIGECHFEIQDNVWGKFKDYKEFVKIKNGKKFIDLKGIAGKKTLDLGIEKNNLKVSRECTFCDENLFSFRRDGKLQAQVVVLGMK